MPKSLKLIIRSLAVIIALAIVLFAGAIVYVSFNKKEIIQYVTTEVADKLNGKLTIDDIELSFFGTFPNISVLLRNVSVTDTLLQKHQHPLLNAQEIFINLGILKLIRNQPPLKGLKIQGADIYLYTDSTGYTNTYLLKPKKDSLAATPSSAHKNELKSIILKDVNMLIEDQVKDKLHRLLVKKLEVELKYNNPDILRIAAKASITVGGLAFNLPRGSFLKDTPFSGKFELQYHQQTNQLTFEDIDIELSNQPIGLSGSFDLKGEQPQFTLNLRTRKITYSTVQALLTPSIAQSLSMVNLDGPLDADAHITGPLKGGEPKLQVNWSAENTQIKTPFLDFDHASFTGFYTNEVVPGLPRKDPNSKIAIKRFTANWHGLPLTAHQIEILDLSHPQLICDLRSEFPLTSLNEVIGSDALQMKQGSGTVQLVYKGPIEKNDQTNTLLNGVVNFKDAVVLYAPRNVEMKEVNGKLTFRNSNIYVENLQCNVLGNAITMQGEARNLLTLINSEPNKINIDWNITSPKLNLNSFTYLLQKRNSRKTTAKKNKTALSDMASKIDEVLEMGKLHVSLKANHLLYKKLHATNVNANVSLLSDRYILNNVSMQHAGGNIQLKGALLNQSPNRHTVNIDVDLKDVNVKEVFTAFDNFGQDGVTDKSLEGKLTAKADASMSIDDAGTIVPSSIVSTVDFSLKDGALINYEPIKKIQRFIFKNRDFDNIRFAELKNRLEIANQEVKINRMEIQSTVLSMFVEGLFSNKGNTDMSIQVPLNNLKKRADDYNPENIGTDKKAGNSIFIRGRPGDDGTIKFKIDLFNKYEKAKQAEKAAE